MKTFDQIKQYVIEENLSERCSCETSAAYDEFCKYVTEAGLNSRLSLISNVDSVKNFSIYHITYDQTDDAFYFNVDLFSKNVTEPLIWVKEQTKLVSWVKNTENKYLLTYQPGSKIGYNFSFTLPVIIKNF